MGQLKDIIFVDINMDEAGKKKTINGPLKEPVTLTTSDLPVGTKRIHVAVTTVDVKTDGDPVPFNHFFYEVGTIDGPDADGSFSFTFKAALEGDAGTKWIPYFLLEILCFG